MSVTIEKDAQNWTTIHVMGRFDYESHGSFREAYADGASCAGVIVDLSGANYIDSAALGMLLILREHVGNDTQRAIIRAARGQPLEVLSIAHFQRLFAFR